MEMPLGSSIGARGHLTARKVNHTVPAPLSYTLRNRLRWGFISGWIAVRLAVWFSWFTAHILGARIVTITTELAAKKRSFYDPLEGAHYLRLRCEGRIVEAEAYAAGRTFWTDYGVLSNRVVTDAGVAFIVDDWDNNGQDLTTLNFHGCGTGTAAEAAGDTALGTESTTQLNPNNTRATGTRSQPAANQYRSVGTNTFDADQAITEHGLFSQAATGGGTLWDRSVFSAINVVGAAGDSIQFTHTTTLNSGG